MIRSADTASPTAPHSNSARNEPPGFQPGKNLARLATNAASYDAKARTVEGIFAAGSKVKRCGWTETLNMDPAKVDLSRVAAGQCKLLDSHNAYGIDAVLGVVESARIEDGQLIGVVRFAETDAGRKAEGMVERGELTGFSIGYSIKRWLRISEDDSGVEEWSADEWALLEVSLVSVPADPAATVRAAAGSITTPENEEDDMHRSAQAAAAAAPEETKTVAPPAPATRGAEPPAPAASEQRAASMSAADGLRLLRRAEFYGHRDIAERMIGEGAAEDAIMEAVRAAATAAPSPEHAIGGPRASITRDEQETRARGLEEAMTELLGGAKAKPDGAARQFMDARDIVDLAYDYLGRSGRYPRSFADREALLDQTLNRAGMHSTSDFPILLENALNRALRARYEVAPATYRALAQQRAYMDFRDHISVRDGDFPQLREVRETGEIVGGTFTESKERTSVKAYAIQVSLSRQLLVNDNLGAINRVLNSRATAVARFEEEAFYAMMLSASGAGPTLLETTRAVFNTTDKTLAASGAAISNASLGLARAAMRGQKTKDGTFINITPSILLVGPDKETEAQGVLAPLYAATAGNVPIFQNLLRLVVSAQITGNAWYVFADPAAGANFEWGLLEGYAAPRFRIDEPFGRQGMSVSLEHDFGCGAIDFRFGYRNAGA